ncbi:hypothetical protein FS827_19630 [Agrobacterium vitis]|uniref:hypothetical protein n=1 Tax=Allorhizobium ampelinum TaxID=3025782 RepID=UPI001F25CD8C|nr:hypothetical protein [Allorhizobium ampelinum]MCF1463520.1 hypothetical protein [Allorhizobium ampelinum]MCF1470762.1 hypothetical protein [Allorhizobium ampelinum]
MKKLLLVLLAIVILGGAAAWALMERDTSAVLQWQQRVETKAELQALIDFKKWLEAQKTAHDPLSTRAFLSRSMLDNILAAFDNTQLKLPEAPDVALFVKSVRADFRPGFPGLAIAATAERSGVTADVSTVARIEPVFDGGTLRLKIHIDSLVPRISWRFLDFSVGGLVRDLTQAKVVDAINKADALGAVSIPLSHTETFALPTTQIPFSTVGMNAAVTLPAVSGTVTAQLTRIVAMPEGIYVYATLNTGAR